MLDAVDVERPTWPRAAIRIYRLVPASLMDGSGAKAETGYLQRPAHNLEPVKQFNLEEIALKNGLIAPANRPTDCVDADIERLAACSAGPTAR
jgi:hypothetical protein